MTKRLLMGNESIALGALRAGVRVCTGYPGTPSTEILETIAREKPDGVWYEWSVNEKSAMEVAAGAAQAGARALVTMKQVGLNVATDPLMSLNVVGVKAGMVVVVADDPGPISSQTEQDTRHYGRFAKICVFDPATPEEAYLMVGEAFELSERIGRPVILRPTTRVCHSYASVEILPDLPRPDAAGFTKDGGRWVIFPRLSYENKLEIERALRDLAETRAGDTGNLLIRGDGSVRRGIASGGVSRQYVTEALDTPSPCDILNIATYPLPGKLCLDFLRGVDEVLVIEELDPFIEDELTRLAARHRIDVRIRGKRTGDTFLAGECSAAAARTYIEKFLGVSVASPSGNESLLKSTPDSQVSLRGAQRRSNPVDEGTSAPPPLPTRPPILCAGCPHRGSFFAVKEAMKGRAAVCTGDIGCYTLGNAMPLDMVDTCLCMGAGVTQAQGISIASSLDGPSSTTVHFAFIGDSTFLHTGIPGLMNAAWNGHDIVICILDNSTTAMTGGQPHPGMGRRLNGESSKKIDIHEICKAAGADTIRRVNAFDLAACKDAATEAAAEKGVRVIIFECPCINIVPKGDALAVTSGCTGCALCVKKLGCPALAMTASDSTKTGKAAMIDPVLCTGCTLCAQICPARAIAGKDGKDAANG